MILSKRINYIKRISFFLFIFSLSALLGSLWLQNSLAGFKFQKTLNTEKLKNISEGSIFTEKINCSKNLDDCKKNIPLNLLQYSNKLGDCFTNNYEISYKINNKILKDRKFIFVNNELENKIKPEYVNKDLEIIINILGKNKDCIKNSKSYILYEIFPSYFEFMYNLKNNPKSILGATEKINPFIYGETSISNIVKRFPIYYVFKPLLFLSVILMYLYWHNYNYLCTKIIDSKKNMFFYFGVASAIFLFFHVLFLGVEIDNKILKLLRKLIIIFFILSEIIAQVLLTLRLYKNKINLSNFCNLKIIDIKIFFIFAATIISLFVISILLLKDFTNKIDYILEWNYFVGLIFYYFLSFLMLKKTN